MAMMSSSSTLENDESQLIVQARAGDVAAFNALVLLHQDHVFTAAYRLMGDAAEAADHAQEAFITAFNKLDTYRGGSFRAWVTRIATNRCLDALRRAKRRPAVSVEAISGESGDLPIADDAATPEESALSAELARAVQACIERLTTDQRVVLVLSDIDGFNYDEIAQQVKAQVGTVKSRLSRARAAVRTCLQGFGELLPPAYRLINDDE